MYTAVCFRNLTNGIETQNCAKIYLRIFKAKYSGIEFIVQSFVKVYTFIIVKM